MRDNVTLTLHTRATGRGAARLSGAGAVGDGGATIAGTFLIHQRGVEDRPECSPSRARTSDAAFTLVRRDPRSQHFTPDGLDGIGRAQDCLARAPARQALHEQNGMIERFFQTLKQECVWLQRFEDRDHAFRIVADWLDRYHMDRPHSALGYLTPSEYREQLAA